MSEFGQSVRLARRKLPVESQKPRKLNTMQPVSSQQDRATEFRRLHMQDRPLLLANVWDASSARMMQSLGANTIATTSAGLAWALGYADGHALPVEQHVAAIERIVRVIDLPLTVDVENGYSDDPTQVVEHVQKFLDVGVVGINIEDASDTPDVLSRKIEAVKAMCAKRGGDLFVNARTDVYLKQLAPGRELEETVHRARGYAAAGADGLFAPYVARASDIESLVREQALPLNVMACPGLPPLPELTRLGVRRVSAGSALAQKLWSSAKLAAATFLEQGSTASLFEGSTPFGEINPLFAKP
jgi:2-methylisocitrate lyase-like PEP mutase family enzyme